MAIAVPLDLVEAARAGDLAQLDRVVEMVWPEAYKLAFGILGEPTSAEDATQDACVALYRTIGSLRDGAAFQAWMYRIVVRAASAQRRRASISVPNRSRQTLANDSDTAIDVWRALAGLSPRLRLLIVLRYYEDLSSTQIAKILRMPEGTVRFQLLVARRELRPLLDVRSDAPIEAAEKVQPNAG